MLAVVVGTSAELIKMAPVMSALRDRGLPVRLWYTGMHMHTDQLRDQLGIAEPDRWLARGAAGADVTSIAQVPGWAGHTMAHVVRNRRLLRRELREGGPGAILVHGDTFTTVLGTLAGRLLGVPVVHVEAGMRSGSVRSPFPEEINRRLVGRLAHVHCAPSSVEAHNLSRAAARGRAILVTGANTVVDTLEQIGMASTALPAGLPDRFGLVTLHRFELVHNPERWRAVLTELAAVASRQPLVMLLGGSDRAALDRHGLTGLIPDTVTVLPKQPYLTFQALLGASDFVVTDSGGLQAECAYRGVPCLVHRERTEQQDGLGANVVLSGWDTAVLRDFLADPQVYRRDSIVGTVHPSRFIADTLPGVLTALA